MKNIILEEHQRIHEKNIPAKFRKNYLNKKRNNFSKFLYTQVFPCLINKLKIYQDSSISKGNEVLISDGSLLPI